MTDNNKLIEKPKIELQTAQPVAITSQQPAPLIPQKTIRPRDEWDLGEMVKTAGTLQVTEKDIAILHTPIKEDEEIEIRPDGIIYMPWTVVADRLNKVFPLQWAAIPQGKPQIQNDVVFWEFHLVIKGIYMGCAIGECNYVPSNATMSYFDAIEGAHSNALTRLGKMIGIGNKLWNKTFVAQWKEKYAEQYLDEKKNKMLWRKKTIKTLEKEEKKATLSANLAKFANKPMQETITIGQNSLLKEPETIKTIKEGKATNLSKILHIIASGMKWDEEKYRKVLMDLFGFNSSLDLSAPNKIEAQRIFKGLQDGSITLKLVNDKYITEEVPKF